MKETLETYSLGFILFLLLKELPHQVEFWISVFWVYKLHQGIEYFEVCQLLLLELREGSLHLRYYYTRGQGFKEFVSQRSLMREGISDPLHETFKSVLLGCNVFLSDVPSGL